MAIRGGGGRVWTPQLWKVFPLATFSTPPSWVSFSSPFPFPLHVRGFAACVWPSSDARPSGAGLPLGWPVTACFFPEEAPGIAGSRLEGHNGRSLPEDTMGLGLHPAFASHVPLCAASSSSASGCAQLRRGNPLSRDAPLTHGCPHAQLRRPRWGSPEGPERRQPCEMAGSRQPHPAPPGAAFTTVGRR